MKRSEQVMAITAVVVLAYFIYDRMGPDETAAVAPVSDLATLATTYESNRKALDSMREVLDKYYRIAEEKKGEANQSLRPDLAMSEDISKWCRDFEFQLPNVNTSTDEIEGVDDYQLVTADLRLEGDLARVSGLMKLLEAKGLLFQDLEIKQNRDREELDVRMSVSRIARTPEDQRQSTSSKRRRS